MRDGVNTIEFFLINITPLFYLSLLILKPNIANPDLNRQTIELKILIVCFVSDESGNVTVLSKLWFNRYHAGEIEPWQEEK